MPTPDFLTCDQVLALHAITIEKHGGEAGVLSPTSIESAVSAPRLYYVYELQECRRLTLKALTALAGCYWYHISENHGFVDGNKRAAFMAAKVFLTINGCWFKVPHAVAEALSLQVAAGQLGREDLMLKMYPHVKWIG